MDPSCESDEEDVILPSSPLYEYFGEFSTETGSPVKTKPENSTTKNSNKVPMNIITCIFNGFSLVQTFIKISLTETRNFLHRFIANITSNSFYSKHSKTDKEFAKETLNIVMNSNILIIEDHTFLESYISLDSYNQPISDRLTLWPRVILPSSALFLVIGGSLKSSYADNLFYSLGINEDIRYLLKIAVFFISSLYLCSFGCHAILYFYHRSRCIVVAKHLKELCVSLRSLIASFKKSFKLVQEAELIARGFTSTSVSGIAQRLELSTLLPISCPDRQLPEFRRSLFSWTKEIFMEHRNATLHLIRDLPLQSELDFPMHYFASLSLAEFGDLLKFNPAFEAEFIELLKVSDNLSLSSLRSMFQLMEVQISEFLKHFCLGMFFYRYYYNDIQINYMRTFEKFSILIDALKKIVNCDKNVLNMVNQSYKLYRSFEASNASCNAELHTSTSSPLHKFSITAHSLNLRLKAALMRIIAVEDYLCQQETLFSQGVKTEQLNQYSVEKLNGLLTEAKAELGAGDECFGDCYKLLNDMLGKENTIQDSTLIPSILPQQCPSHVLQELIEYKIDRIIEDEVFEAVIDESDLKTREEKKFCCSDEGENKVDMKAAANLMRELQTVLVVKAEEHRLREEIAIQAKKSREINYTESNPSTDLSNDEFVKSIKITNSLENDPNTQRASKCGSNENNASCFVEKTTNEHIDVVLSELQMTGMKKCTKEADNVKEITVCDCNDDFKSSEGVVLTGAEHRDYDTDVKEAQLTEDNSVMEFRRDNDFRIEDNSTEETCESLHNDQLSSPNCPEYRLMQGGSFAASIAAMAAARQKLFNLQSQTFEFGEDEDVGDESD